MSEKKILLVDDSRTSLFMESMILKRHHYEVVTAGDGEEAIAKVRTERPDLIVMDVVMPKKTGVEACRALKGDPATRDIPVILVTVRATDRDVQQGSRAGADAYLIKPFHIHELTEQIDRFLRPVR